MTSQERHEARYQRRKAKRQERKQARCDALGPMDKVFSYRTMFYYGRKCCNGVRWKQSVQNFEGHLFSGTAKRRREVLDGTWKPKKCTHFTLRERGKVRPIDAPHITDRQIHKTLCNEVLVPLYNPCMIYDNGASQKGKGLHWHYRRLKEPLHWHYRRYGREGVKRARRKLKLFHREFKEGKRTLTEIEQYMECQSAYYRNFNDHGRLLRLRRLYHAIFFGGAECIESSKTGPQSA